MGGFVAAADTSDEAGERTQSAQGEPLYLFGLRDEARTVVAVFAVSWKSGESEPRTFAYVHAMLRPVLECLRRELMLRARSGEMAAATVTAHDAEADLQVLLNAGDEQQDGAGDGVRNLLQSMNMKLRPRLLEQLEPGTRIVSHAFDMGGEWEPEQTREVGSSTIYLWTVPER